MTAAKINVSARQSIAVTFESLESRQFMSVNPAVVALQTTHEAVVSQPLVAASTAKSAATTTAQSTVTLRTAAAARKPISVITLRNTTANTVNYQVEWEHQTTWTTYSVQPHHSKICWQTGQLESATIRYDASFAAGFQGQLYSLSSKPFVMGGREHWSPAAANDGMTYTFTLNSAHTGLSLGGDYSIDTTHHAELRGTVTSSFRSFQGKFEVLGPSTPNADASADTYNCIAWSLGITNHWVWPGESLGGFDKLYAQYGFRRLAKADFSMQAGVEKIALYALNGKCTHAARQNTDGTWSSKLGSAPLIRHNLVDAFGNSIYGHPIAVYVKFA
jgi:hypothetical protein